MKRAQIDAYLLRWDADGFNQRQTRRVHTRPVRALMQNGRPNDASGVRQRLSGIARKTPQAMVRISGGGRGMGRIRAHLDYISRHGQLPLEDQDGERYAGKEDLGWLGYAWQNGGTPIPDESGRREALNLVLSMPAGTDAQALQRAAREFAQDEFSGHQYAMALHTFLDDPAREPSPHPHVHLCVKIADDEGRRLNPRKVDLRRWRERFAERLRAHGIDAAASSRLERFQPIRGTPQGLHHLRARGAAQASAGRTARHDPHRQREGVMLQRYASVAQILASADDAADRGLAVGLVNLCQKAMGLPVEREDAALRERQARER
ncbi:relaxase/mobilization nuclease domain-containing protein [Duganella levis]|uniref:MobA/VirD2-like nuclease domain-containing protein n=1 Tax=Duganella levis TaxID=2692169 RepID=A0ABW9W5A3_9BURK|nr:hypothetical protein [Duganella levis]MYN29199.1 hypothetical protein [Duganella levis]